MYWMRLWAKRFKMKSSLAQAYATKALLKKGTKKVEDAPIEQVDTDKNFLSNEEMSESPFQEIEPMSDEQELTESGFLPKESTRKSKLSDIISKRIRG
jgi:hypothetical protein